MNIFLTIIVLKTVTNLYTKTSSMDVYLLEKLSIQPVLSSKWKCYFDSFNGQLQ